MLDPWMGRNTTQARAKGFRIYHRFQPELGPTGSKRIKLEINTREHFTVYGLEEREYSVNNRWYAEKANIITYSLDELAETKLRALYQRKKGKDLFDIDRLLLATMIDPERTVQAFHAYLEKQNLSVKRKELVENLNLKMAEPTFREDVESLLVPGTDFDVDKAFENTLRLI